MTTITQTKVKDLKEFTSFISDNVKSKTLWYRGCGNNRYRLIPRLYRHPKIKKVKELLSTESEMISWFKNRSNIYLEKSNLGEWEYLFLMQHFGVPTRLLDWTENPFIALYFAVTAGKKNKDAQFASDVAVWILDPAEWNQTVLKHIGYSGGAVSLEDKVLNGYKQTGGVQLMSDNPIAMYGTHSNERIVAQRGVFVIFGKNNIPMEQICSKNKYFKKDCLRKVTIPKDKVKDMLVSLTRIGYTDSVIFPDLEGLAREIKMKHNYEV